MCTVPNGCTPASVASGDREEENRPFSILLGIVASTFITKAADLTWCQDCCKFWREYSTLRTCVKCRVENVQVENVRAHKRPISVIRLSRVLSYRFLRMA